ncbi:hypothetical protein QQF64_018217 [Cirrhinus molitorella]|uniref:Uncharacterized protein n=1 Tax=Cirrhinus molitorella TaxID=172907 RepID=A0ABR3LP50_9TELE
MKRSCSVMWRPLGVPLRLRVLREGPPRSQRNGSRLVTPSGTSQTKAVAHKGSSHTHTHTLSCSKRPPGPSFFVFSCAGDKDDTEAEQIRAAPSVQQRPNPQITGWGSIHISGRREPDECELHHRQRKREIEEGNRDRISRADITSVTPIDCSSSSGDPHMFLFHFSRSASLCPSLQTSGLIRDQFWRVSEDAFRRPSLVFCQACAAQARHLSAAAATDKEEAINPCKITRADSLSHRNTPRETRSVCSGRQTRVTGHETHRRPGHIGDILQRQADLRSPVGKRQMSSDSNRSVGSISLRRLSYGEPELEEQEVCVKHERWMEDKNAEGRGGSADVLELKVLWSHSSGYEPSGRARVCL